MKLYLKYLVSVFKNPMFYFCEFMAVLAIWEKMFLLALMFGITFPLIAVTLAFIRDKYHENYLK